MFWKIQCQREKVWSRNTMGYAEKLLVTGGSVYILDDKKTIAAFSLNGKKRSLKNIDIVKATKDVINAKYFPEGLPNKKRPLTSI